MKTLFIIVLIFFSFNLIAQQNIIDHSLYGFQNLVNDQKNIVDSLIFHKASKRKIEKAKNEYYIVAIQRNRYYITVVLPFYFNMKAISREKLEEELNITYNMDREFNKLILKK